jgi:predicted nucleotidyltransferase
VSSSISERSTHLPPSLREQLEHFSAALSVELGAGLSALVLFGSAARGEYREGQSDVDLVLVLRDASVEQLRSLSNTLQLARFRSRFEAILLTEAEVQGAADVFPILYRDIQECHVLLAGRDVFSALAISPEHLRLRIEQELREAQIRLRRTIVDSSAEPRLIAAAVLRKCKQLRSPLRALLQLLGHACDPALGQVLDAAALRFELDLNPLHNPQHAPLQAALALTTLLERSVQLVDRLSLPVAGGSLVGAAQAVETQR